MGQAHVKAVSITHRDVRLDNTNPPQKIIGAVFVIGQGPLQQFYRCSCVCLLFLLGSITSSIDLLCICIAQHCKYCIVFGRRSYSTPLASESGTSVRLHHRRAPPLWSRNISPGRWLQALHHNRRVARRIPPRHSNAGNAER
jgi:hypothetical protein